MAEQPAVDPTTNTEDAQWQNWVRNQHYAGPYNVFHPTSRDELKEFLTARSAGEIVRVQGQTHAQTPVILHETSHNTVLIDMDSLKDVGENGMEMVGFSPETSVFVKVNTGVTETDLEKFLLERKLSLKTVTAGGFFSIGGMTSVDVHGATLNSGIFAENVIELEIMDGLGNITTVTKEDPEIHFARVNFGALGVVLSVTIECMRRISVEGDVRGFTETSIEGFQTQMMPLINEFQRLEVFFNPYSGEYVSGCWNVIGVERSRRAVPTEEKGADVIWGEPVALAIVESIQYSWGTLMPRATTWVSLRQGEGWMKEAIGKGDELWLTEQKIIRAMFMSYYIPIGALNEDGLETAWQAMDVVTRLTNTTHLLPNKDPFHVVAPVEFRFVKGGKSVLSGAFSAEDEDEWFVNLDLIGYLDRRDPPPGINYKEKLMTFFGSVEREWFDTFHGLPHQGKMFGFYNPATGEPAAVPFNPDFLRALYERREERVEGFNEYRKHMDPQGLFANEFVRDLVGES